MIYLVIRWYPSDSGRPEVIPCESVAAVTAAIYTAGNFGQEYEILGIENDVIIHVSGINLLQDKR